MDKEKEKYVVKFSAKECEGFKTVIEVLRNLEKECPQIIRDAFENVGYVSNSPVYNWLIQTSNTHENNINILRATTMVLRGILNCDEEEVKGECPWLSSYTRAIRSEEK